jgi:hypothetical protein
MSEFRQVRLPEDLCAEVEKRFSTRFGSLEELLAFVLRDLARDDAGALDGAEQQIIEQRLRDLGYI